MLDTRKLSELVKCFLNGDETVYGEIMNLVKDPLYYKAYSIVANEADANDIIQECFINAYYKMNTIEDPDKFLPWMMTSVVNKSKDLFKTSHRLHNTYLLILKQTMMKEI